MADRTPKKPTSAPLGDVAAGWLEQARAGSVWTPDELRALEVAAQALDRAERCRDAIEREGQTTVNSRGSVIAHPLLSFEATNRAAWAKLCRELGLIGAGDHDATAATATRLSEVRSINASYGARHARGQA